MHISEQNLKMIQLIMTGKNLSLTDLTYQLQINLKKLNYELDKVNDYFNIQQVDDRVYFSDIEETKVQLSRLHIKNIILTEKERYDLIILYLLQDHDYVSLEHMMEFLTVSRNTLLQDLKNVRNQIKLMNGQLIYDRTHGYSINLNPEDRDLLFINVLHQLSRTYFIDYYLHYISNKKFDTKNYDKDIEEFEFARKVQFTDYHKRLLTLARFILDHHLYYSKASNQETGNMSLIKLIIESTSIMSQEISLTDQYSRDLLLEFVHKFEIYGGIIIYDKDKLISSLSTHFYPAVLRAKYKINSSVNATQLLNDELKSIYPITKMAIKNLEDALDIRFNENEITLWSLYFAGVVRSQGNQVERHHIAVVVCPNGLAVSHSLTQTLKYHFQSLVFIEPTALSKVNSIEEQVDIIFSTHPVESKKPVYLISQSLNKSEIHHLSNKLNEEFNLPFKSQYSLNDLLEVIKQNAVIKNEAKLMREIKALLKINHHFKEGYQPMLKELLTEQFIQTQASAKNWEEAIKITASPLLTSNIITNNYISAMINTVNELGPYIVIMPEIAIPHARPEDGALEVGLSFANFESPIEFPGEKEVKAMIVLAAKDQNSHLKALSEMTELLGNENSLEILKTADSNETILKLIDQLNNN